MFRAFGFILAFTLPANVPLLANCPEALGELVPGQALLQSENKSFTSQPFPLQNWIQRVSELTETSFYDAKMRHPRFEAEIQIIRYNFFRMPLSSIEEILDFMISQLETRWGSLWMNEIQLIKMTVEHIQAQANSNLSPQANAIEKAIKKRLPLKFSPPYRNFDSRPPYNYRTEW